MRLFKTSSCLYPILVSKLPIVSINQLISEIFEKNVLNRINSQLQSANSKASMMYQKNLDHLGNLDNLDEKTREMVEEAKKYRDNSKGVYVASYWLNKKYAILIYGSITLIVLIFVMFFYRLILG